MRSLCICVFFVSIVQGSREDNDFRPTPIPLGEWKYDKRDSSAGTLHETIKIETPLVAAMPAHYWEDALRHSVYLTLVRDKIDQLIAKGEVISPDSKPDGHISQDVDDHDLWEKIKTAPFDRVAAEEPAPFGDVTIMAKGRLVENQAGFRFSEDEMLKEKCNDSCMNGVKAFWSVKRVRQRNVETSPGHYHYELTFSVISQKQKKERPNENPARTFTVRETTPEKVLDMPQEHRAFERQQPRPERAIWVHKNIAPVRQARQYQGLDRLFSSLFSDDDDEPVRYVRPAKHPSQHPQYSKIGYVSSPSDQQKRLTPYPYNQHVYKYSQPNSPYTHHQHYSELEPHGPPNGHFPPSDHRYPNKPGKTTRPAVLPTPLNPVTLLPPKNWTREENQRTNTTDSSTKSPEIITIRYSNPRPGSLKINYIPDHVRTPIYNAPPGVFVTLDKKPFKPMPPLKYVTKPMKTYRPVDFRPSPQVLDMHQFSEPDPLKETSFRPITWDYSNANHTANTTEKIEVAESSTSVNETKANQKGKKPPKKHENIKSQRITTSAPEIITVSSISDDDSDSDLQWANVLGAFSQTTPMASQKDKPDIKPESSTLKPTSTTPIEPTTPVKKRTTTTTEAVKEIVTTTLKPKKRTRPPPKFSKPEKPKKHKRITTTTTTTTTKAPEPAKTTQDLTPQASSAAKPSWTANKTQSTTESSTTSTSTTTAKPTTSTRPTTTHQPKSTTTEQKVKNPTTISPKVSRFRLSTLMQKGTSVKHDKWSTAPAVTEKTKTVNVPSKHPPRRKGSNFQGYVSSTQRSIDNHEEVHDDHGYGTTQPTKKQTSKPTEPTYDDDEYENDDWDHQNFESEDQPQTQDESKDHSEYIFETSTPNDKINEVVEHTEPLEEEIISSSYSSPKNKTKCKKKKNQNSTNADEITIPETTSTASTKTTTETAASIFDELFGSFTNEDSTTIEKNITTTPKTELEEEESGNHAQFVKLDDDLQAFLDSIEGDKRSNDEYDDEHDVEVEEEDSPFESEEDDGPTARDNDEEYEEDRPMSFLELMAME